MSRAFGREPVPVREGGSIGAVSILTEMLGVPVAFLPLSLPEHGYHAPDEFFDWQQAAGASAPSCTRSPPTRTRRWRER